MTIEELINKHSLFVEITVDFSDGAYPMYDCTVIDLATCEKHPVVGFDRYMYPQALKYCIEAAEKIIKERGNKKVCQYYELCKKIGVLNKDVKQCPTSCIDYEM